jgi:hypothetical protein
MKIDAALAELHSAAEMLREQFPGIEADDVAWLDNLDGVTDAVSLCEHLAERAIHLVALQSAALDRAKQLQARARRFEAEEERLRGVLLALVDAAGGKKMVLPSATLSPRNVAAKIVASDESKTPAQYMIEIVSHRPDRKAIRDAIEIGADVDGWYAQPASRSLAILVR